MAAIRSVGSVIWRKIIRSSCVIVTVKKNITKRPGGGIFYLLLSLFCLTNKMRALERSWCSLLIIFYFDNLRWSRFRSYSVSTTPFRSTIASCSISRSILGSLRSWKPQEIHLLTIARLSNRFITMNFNAPCSISKARTAIPGSIFPRSATLLRIRHLAAGTNHSSLITMRSAPRSSMTWSTAASTEESPSSKRRKSTKSAKNFRRV